MDTLPVRKLIIESGEAPSVGRLSEILVELSSWFATFSQELEDIMIFKADRWMDIRELNKSDKSTDRMWDKSDEGKKEIRLRSQLKYIEKTMGAIKFRLKVKEGESFNRF